MENYLLEKVSGNWCTPLHKTTKRLKDKHGPSLKDMLLVALHTKVMHGIFDVLTAPKDCNCRNTHKVNDECIFSGDCQTANMIYKATVMGNGKYYKGKTQNSLKE